jgi:hypothetical protein
MKLNSRLLISELYAAGTAAVASAILIAGCATGERSAKFWDKGDVKSSDAYVAAEMARDQSLASNKAPASTASGKVATVSGTQDSSVGHVALPDFPDPPSSPMPPDPTPKATAKASVGGANAAGAAAGGGESIVAVAGGAETVGASAGGSILAPYVQKRAPSGTIDNSTHDGEIVKPRPVYAKQIDPFAENDGNDSWSQPHPAKRPVPPATPSSNSMLTSAPAAAPTSSLVRSVPNRNPFEDADGASATLPAGQGVVSHRPSVAAAPASAAVAFDPLAPPLDLTPDGRSADQPAAAKQFTQTPIAMAKPTSTEWPPPKAASFAPVHRRFGVSLGDEELADEEEHPSHPATQPAVVQTATQTAPAPSAPPANPYENDNKSPCVAPPAQSPSRAPSASGAPAQPQDNWESTNASQITSPRITRSVAPSVKVEVGVTASTADVPATSAIKAQSSAARAAASQPPLPQFPVQSTPVVPVTESRSVLSTNASAEQVSAVSSSAGNVQLQSVQPSDAMICDSVSVHRRYTGEDSSPLAPAAQQASAPSRQIDMRSQPAAPTGKKAARPAEGKSASYWDERTGDIKQTVSTADFSVPVGPQPLQADDARAIDRASTSSSELAAHDSSRSRSHAWFVIGVVAGLAATAVLCRRWRSNCNSQMS